MMTLAITGTAHSRRRGHFSPKIAAVHFTPYSGARTCAKTEGGWPGSHFGERLRENPHLRHATSHRTDRFSCSCNTRFYANT